MLTFVKFLENQPTRNFGNQGNFGDLNQPAAQPDIHNQPTGDRGTSQHATTPHPVTSANGVKELDKIMQLLIGQRGMTAGTPDFMSPEQISDVGNDEVTEMINSVSSVVPELRPQLQKIGVLFRQALAIYDELDSRNESVGDRLDRHVSNVRTQPYTNPYMGIQAATRDFESTAKDVETVYRKIQSMVGIFSDKPSFNKFIQAFERFYQVWSSYLPTIRRYLQKFQGLKGSAETQFDRKNAASI